MPSVCSVRRAGRWECSTRRMISSFSEAGTLIPRLPHPRSCFFKQPQFERLFGHDLFQLLGLALEVLDFTIGRRPGRVDHPAPRGSFLQLNTACGSPGGCLSLTRSEDNFSVSDFCLISTP